jgi:multicomponent Na+:H+ antiporter subunit D
MTTAGLEAVLPLPVVIPIGGAVASPLLARLSKRLPLIVSLLAMAGSTACMALLAPRVYSGHVLVHYMGNWVPVGGKALGIAFGADPFGLTYGLAVGVIGAVLLLFTLSDMGHLGGRELGGYTCLFLLLLAALIGTALTADLFNTFVWFEVAALASYGLTGFFLERPLALEAAFKVLVLTTVAGFLVFIGASLLYSDHGALNLGQLHMALAGHVTTTDLVALGLLVAGFATKLGLVPFHGWLPDAHTAAPGPVSALFSGLMVNLGVVVIARLALQVFGAGGARPLLGLLVVLGVVSALTGAVLALAQDDLKRLLAYDTISQMGVLAVGLGTGSAAGEAGMTYHLISHALFKSLLFLCAGAIVTASGMTKLSEMGGLARRRPGLAVAFVIGVMAIAGIPPLNGYVSVGLIHKALEDGHQPGVLALMLAAQVVTIAALARAAWLAFFRRREEPLDHLEPLRPGMRVAFGTLAAGCVAFGVLPFSILRHVAGAAAGALLSGGGLTYAHDVLHGGGAVPRLAVSFTYLDPVELLTVAGTTLAGLALAAVYIRRPEPAPIRALRALHNGSANDYAAYGVIGVIATLATMVLR